MTYGQGRGFGFRGTSPAWPYVGRGRGGLPRCAAPGLQRGVPYGGAAWAAPGPDDLEMLKSQAATLKAELTSIEQRISELEKKEA
jgi:hypothetical protein